MSWKLFVQIVLLIIIAVFVMTGVKCLKKSMFSGGSWKCPVSQTGAKGSYTK